MKYFFHIEQGGEFCYYKRMKESLGKAIQNRRKALKITALALAGKVGIDRTYITKVESDVVIPPRKLLDRIIEELKDTSLITLYFAAKRHNLNQKIKTLAKDEAEAVKKFKHK